jgi:hypothetical protein
MGVLARGAVAALVLGGCYSPSVRDCTVSCESPGNCASGQVCGSDGWCAAPEIAGRCAMIAADAGVHDARAIDASATRDAASDAPRAVALRVQIAGKGSVLIDGIGACSSKDPQRGDCTYSVTAGLPLTVHAVEIELDQQFAMWTSMTCAGESARCVFTPVAATTIAARFAHVGLHGDRPQ